MKKPLLLLSAALLAGIPAIAQDENLEKPRQYENLQVVDISPDGRYGFCDLFGTVISIIDFKTGVVSSYGSEDDWETEEDESDLYAMGHGHMFSKTGVTIANHGEPAIPVYMKDGEWHELNVPVDGMSCMANSINAEGTVIVGMAGLRPMSLDEGDTPMNVPAIWVL